MVSGDGRWRAFQSARNDEAAGVARSIGFAKACRRSFAGDGAGSLPTILGSTNQQVRPPEGEGPQHGVYRWRSRHVLNSARTRSWGCSPRGRWARSTAPVTLAWTATSRSRFCPSEVADAERLRRFEQEARAAGALNHPNILAVYDVGTHQGAPYVVSELLEGQTLRGRLAADALPVAQGRRATHSDRARPRRCSRQGDRPPRSQARERLRHARRPDQDPRLRPRQADAPERRADGDRHVPGRRSRAWSWARSATCRPSRCAAQRWTPARTSSPRRHALRDAHRACALSTRRARSRR